MKKVCPIALITAFFIQFGIAASGRHIDSPPDDADDFVSFVSTGEYADGVMERFKAFYGRGFQEKVYLHTDKPYYCAGESLWFKGYLLNAVTHEPSLASGIINVELINAGEEVVSSVRLGRDSLGRFHNRFELPPDISPGDYLLRAYTMWMTNEGDDLVFTRAVRIENPLDTRVSTDISYGKNDDGTVTMTARFVGQDNSPIAGNKVSYIVDLGDKRSRPVSVYTDDDGSIRVTFAPSADSLRSVVELDMERQGYDNFRRTVPLPAFSDDFDVQFFPEGGVLVPGPLQQLAFKAVGSDGLSVEVSGIMYDGEKEVARFRPEHNGMGVIGVIPSAGSSYRAEVTGPGGITKRFDIPVSTSGCPLQVMRVSGNVICRILPTADIPVSGLGLVVHCRGKLVAAEEFAQGVMQVMIPEEMLLPGVAQLTLADKASGRGLSRRLIYVRDYEPLAAFMESDMENYGAREKVNLLVTVNDEYGQAVQGDFSLAVTDASVVKADMRDVDIQSYLELTSNLKGYIEDPGFYFRNEDGPTDRKLDILMITQGWSRFETADILSGNLRPYGTGAEGSPTIEGRVEWALGKNPKNMNIVIMDQYEDFTSIIPLEKNSRFRVEDVNVRDSAWVAVQVLHKSGDGNWGLTLHIRQDSLPAPRFSVPKRSYREFRTPVPQEYVSQAGEQYRMEGGMMVRDIEKIVVRDRRAATYDIGTYIAGEDLKTYGNIPLRNLVLTMSGVFTWTHEDERTLQVGVSRNDDMSQTGWNTIIVYDGQVVPFEFIQHQVVSELVSVRLVTGAEAYKNGYRAIYYRKGITYDPIGKITPSGVIPLPPEARMPHPTAIIIDTKSGRGIDEFRNTSRVILKNIGVTPPAEFYQPKYEVAENRDSATPDLRSTIAWVPVVLTDSRGEAEISFYTADKSTEYEVELQGVSLQGKPCVYRTTVQRTQ